MMPFVRACRILCLPIGAAFAVAELDNYVDMAVFAPVFGVVFGVTVVGGLIISNLVGNEIHADGTRHDA